MANTAIETNQSTNPSNHPVIQVENVSKLFRTPSEGTITALQSISLTVPHGEFITVVGPSGCGKSTLLKLIAGFSPPSSGRILCQNEEVHGLNTKVGYVPQESKLFPWLTVEETSGSVSIPNAIREKNAGSRCSSSSSSPVWLDSRSIIRPSFQAA